MIHVTGIIKALDTNKYYLIINSKGDTIACEVKTYNALELLENNRHHEKEIDLKTNLKEYEFLQE